MSKIEQQVVEHIQKADAIVIGASNGLSIAEGFHIFADNAWFRSHFGDFRARHGWRCLLDGMFHRFASGEEKWGFWSRLAALQCYGQPVSPMMQQLRALTADKPCFVLTSNGEDHFVPAGFAAAQVFDMEGSFSRSRCARGCSEAVWSNREEVLRMAALEKDGYVPTAALPVCSHCGGPVEVDMASSQAFFRTQRWQQKAKAFQDFLMAARGKRLLVLELGIGARNQLIKAPLMQLVADTPEAFYITVNKGELFIPSAIADRALGVEGDLCTVIADVYAYMSHDEH